MDEPALRSRDRRPLWAQEITNTQPNMVDAVRFGSDFSRHHHSPTTQAEHSGIGHSKKRTWSGTSAGARRSRSKSPRRVKPTSCWTNHIPALAHDFVISRLTDSVCVTCLSVGIRAQSECIGLVLESDIGANFSGVVYRELRDGTGPSALSYAAYWRADNENPAVATFLNLLSERYPSTSFVR